MTMLAGSLVADLDALLAPLLAPAHAGAALSVLRDGEVIHQRCAGLANIEHEVAVTPDTVFRLGSVSKSLCASLIFLFASRGMLRLDDPAGAFLPDLPEAVAAITIRQLLTMTSGLHDATTLTIFGGGSHVALSRNAQMALVRNHGPLMFEPGTQMLYSNTNYRLLTEILEIVSGEPFADLARKELFEPLGMLSATVSDEATLVVANRARGYLPGKGGTPRAGLMLYELGGEGAIDMSMRDLVRWFQAFRSGALGLDLAALLTRHAPLASGEPSYYRMGMTVRQHGGRTRIGHAGGMPGYLADFVWYPDADVAVLLLANWMDAGLLALADKVIDLLEGPRDGDDSEDGQAAGLQSGGLPGGLYLQRDHGFALQLGEDSGHPFCVMMGERARLERDPAGGWRPADKPTEYRLEMGPEDTLLVSFGGAPLVFAPAPATAGEPDLAAYAGAYVNAMTGERHIVSRANDGLEVRLETRLRSLSWERLIPRGHDLFSAPVAGEPTATNLTLRFERDAAGTVTGFRYSTFRCRGLLFTRERSDGC